MGVAEEGVKSRRVKIERDRMSVGEVEVLQDCVDQSELRYIEKLHRTIMNYRQTDKPFDRPQLHHVKARFEVCLHIGKFGGGVSSNIHVVNVNNDDGFAGRARTIVNAPFNTELCETKRSEHTVKKFVERMPALLKTIQAFDKKPDHIWGVRSFKSLWLLHPNLLLESPCKNAVLTSSCSISQSREVARCKAIR
jgi:hypothetical protein